MYTPLRLKPRIFPAVVSATVAASEAMTLLHPQPLAADFAFGGASGAGCAIAVVDKMPDPANPAPKVAMPRTKDRRSLEKGVNWLFNFFCTSGFLIGPFQRLILRFEKEPASSG